MVDENNKRFLINKNLLLLLDCRVGYCYHLRAFPFGNVIISYLSSQKVTLSIILYHFTINLTFHFLFTSSIH